MIQNKFNIGDKVKINIFEKINGRVISVWQTQKALKYEVRYFWECTAKEVYFYEDELELIE